MLLTPHILAGMFVGNLADNYFISPIYGFLSYFVLEVIPHWDPENFAKTKVRLMRILDLVVGIISFFGIAFFNNLNPKLVLGGVFATIPYIFFVLLMIFKPNASLSKFYKKFRSVDRSFWGILVQFAICVLCVVFIFNAMDFPGKEKFFQ